ncbi:hypothetical protein BAUCODRAFT_375135 [Baudoinia panamericana UAMH 10762]|uniref:Uncharacterized protein n=1 Tax=Baudoinia panamericana (strain UAMH 10762) TaxID=717646 RepID=M2MPD5_BAUPA|nr:uncharacterized protein BAUCODRAFT_375135 [Baudoinia panamericana UAMH 10762]EMC98591.1 hypothetical protein BAUCODRAFT_375135 [Baudoinia panamericana UAMH 10762]
MTCLDYRQRKSTGRSSDSAYVPRGKNGTEVWAGHCRSAAIPSPSPRFVRLFLTPIPLLALASPQWLDALGIEIAWACQ